MADEFDFIAPLEHAIESALAWPDPPENLLTFIQQQLNEHMEEAIARKCRADQLRLLRLQLKLFEKMGLAAECADVRATIVHVESQHAG
jgi:hypothetical protein